MQHSSFSLGKFWGIEVRVHYTWFIVFFLATWSLANYYFPVNHPFWSNQANWVVAMFASLLLFLSVLVHEFMHSFVGNQAGITVRRITLFVFGGVAETTKEPGSAKAELRMILAGPVSTFFLTIAFWLLSLLPLGQYIQALLTYLYMVNAGLLIFNIIPAFPLDGGRALRALLWYKNNNVLHATRTAAKAGRVFAYLLMAFGVLNFALGSFISGIWFIFLGWFLKEAGFSALRQLEVQELLEDVNVASILSKVSSVDPSDTINSITPKFMQQKAAGLPVLVGGKLVGLITTEDVHKAQVKKLATVKQAMVPAERLVKLKSSDNAYTALQKLLQYNIAQLPVLDGAKFKGLVTRNDIIGAISIKEKL